MSFRNCIVECAPTTPLQTLAVRSYIALVPRYHEFRYARPPRVDDWLPLAGWLVLTCVLTWVAVIETSDPAPTGERFGDRFALWLVVFGNWLLTLYFARFALRKLHAFIASEPAITVDESGITLPGRWRKRTRLSWSEMESVSLGHSWNRTELLVKTGKLFRSVPLDDLDVEAQRIWQTVRGYAERASR